MAQTATRRRPGQVRRAAARVRAEAASLGVRDLVRGVLEGYARNDLLSYASSIAFQVLFGLIPLALFAVGMLGFLELHDLWRLDIAPEIQRMVSPAAFAIIDETANEVLTTKQLIAVTLGAVLAVWEFSGATWAIMRVSCAIYGTPERRSFWRQIWVSIALALAVVVLLLLVVAVARLVRPLTVAMFGPGPTVVAVAFVVRWGIVAVLLLLIVGVLVRFAPDTRRPAHWVGLGALLVVAGWIVMSLAFGSYLYWFANYGSLFSNLATLIVGMEYLFLSSIVLLTGLQVDALTRQRVEGEEESGGREANGPARAHDPDPDGR